MGISASSMDIIGHKEIIAEFVNSWEDDSEYVMAHTSGSTGAPKTISLLKSDMLLSAEATNRFFCVDKSSLLYMPLSIDYIAGKMMVVRALVADCALQVVTPSVNPLPEMPYGSISLLPIVPAQTESLLSSPWIGLVENIIVGGSPLSTEREESLLKLPSSCYATYGMTETCSHIALRKLGEDYYKALPGIRFSSDDRCCLVIESEGFSWHRLVTNDVVELIDSTTFRWLGRADNIINSGGIKIVPEDIERRISSLLDGRRFYITSRPSAKWGEELVMVVEGSDFDVEVFQAAVQSLLPRKLHPKDVILLPEIPLTSSGKIIRQKIENKSC